MRYKISKDGEETVYDFEDVFLFISGTEIADGFVIDTMVHVINSNQHKGYGTAALLVLKKNYKHLYVKEVMKQSFPFWDKMVERNVIDGIISCYIEPYAPNK